MVSSEKAMTKKPARGMARSPVRLATLVSLNASGMVIIEYQTHQETSSQLPMFEKP